LSRPGPPSPFCPPCPTFLFYQPRNGLCAPRCKKIFSLTRNSGSVVPPPPQPPIPCLGDLLAASIALKQPTVFFCWRKQVPPLACTPPVPPFPIFPTHSAFPELFFLFFFPVFPRTPPIFLSSLSRSVPPAFPTDRPNPAPLVAIFPYRPTLNEFHFSQAQKCHPRWCWLETRTWVPSPPSAPSPIRRFPRPFFQFQALSRAPKPIQGNSVPPPTSNLGFCLEPPLRSSFFLSPTFATPFPRRTVMVTNVGSFVLPFKKHQGTEFL